MKHFCKTIDHLYEFKPVITACFPIVQTHAHTKYILPKKKKKKRLFGNEKGVNCLQVRLCWCVLAAAAFASVEKHREICSAVLPLSTMEDSRGWLTGFGAASGIHSQDPDHSSLCVFLRERWLFTLQQAQMSHWIFQHQMHCLCTYVYMLFYCAIFSPY